MFRTTMRLHLARRPWPALIPLCALILSAMATPSQVPPPADPSLPSWPSLDGGGAYVLFLDRDATIVNGTAQDYERAKALRTAPQEELFWFQRGGAEYVSRDTALLRDLQALFETPMRLGAQQAALSRQQTNLAARLAAVTARQQREKDLTEDLGVRRNQLASEQASLMEEGENADSVAAELQSLETEEEGMQQPQVRLVDQRKRIAEQQQSLARQQEDLGRQAQQATQEAERRLHQLVARAISRRAAKPVK